MNCEELCLGHFTIHGPYRLATQSFQNNKGFSVFYIFFFIWDSSAYGAVHVNDRVSMNTKRTFWFRLRKCHNVSSYPWFNSIRIFNRKSLTQNTEKIESEVKSFLLFILYVKNKKSMRKMWKWHVYHKLNFHIT